MQMITLNNGIQMPAAGYGVFKLDDAQTCESCVRHAIETGYRLIDTAAMYHNETWVGNAVKNCGVPREELFITTKLWVHEMGYEKAKRGFEHSLERLGLDYIDLFLVHWPYGDIAGTWRALEEMVRAGKVRAIGVCNFMEEHMETLLQTAEILPVVDQLECHPILQLPELRKYLAAHEIVTEAWSPLGRMHPLIKDNAVLNGLAAKHNKTLAHIILRWHLQEGIVAIPKSATPNRIESNFAIWDFELSETEMNEIRAVNTNTYTNTPPADPATRENILSRPVDF